MLVRRAKEIATAGLVLAAAEGALAQGPAKPPGGSPYNPPAVAPLLAPGTLPPTPVCISYDGAWVPPTDPTPPSFGHHAVRVAPGVPFGESLRLNFGAQVANGGAARMTLYDYDFECGTARLNGRGRDRVRQLGRRLACTPAPLVVEQLPLAPELSLARRETVLRELAAAGLTVAPARVLVGTPIALPLRGVEAELIYQTLIGQTGSAGMQPGAAATGGNRTVQPTGASSPPISR